MSYFSRGRMLCAGLVLHTVGLKAASSEYATNKVRGAGGTGQTTLQHHTSLGGITCRCEWGLISQGQPLRCCGITVKPLNVTWKLASRAPSPCSTEMLLLVSKLLRGAGRQAPGLPAQLCAAVQTSMPADMSHFGESAGFCNSLLRT